MAFTVETGTIVTGANSYISLADARAYALDRNLTLPTDDTECEQALVRAADYIDGKYGHRFQGVTVDIAQEMVWPRYQVYLDGRLLPYDEIPTLIKEAQVQAAVALAAGV
jgi:NAD(P)-dependent dehydrogenase (short-subunit alcohol dehydrogenase family)